MDRAQRQLIIKQYGDILAEKSSQGILLSESDLLLPKSVIRHALFEELVQTHEPARQHEVGTLLVLLARFRPREEARDSVAAKRARHQFNKEMGLVGPDANVEVSEWVSASTRELDAIKPEMQALGMMVEHAKRRPSEARQQLTAAFDKQIDQRAKAELRERAPFLLFAIGLALALTLLRWVLRSGLAVHPNHQAVILTNMFWLLSLVGVGGLVLQMWWVGVSWAGELDTPSRRKRLWKALVLTSAFATPIVVLLVRTDVELARLIRSSWDSYLLVIAVLVALFAYSFAKRWPYSRMETYVTVYVGTVVLSVLVGLRESAFAGEAVLRHLIAFSLAGLAGAYSARRAD